MAQDRRGWLGPFRIGIGATWSASDAKWRRLRHAKQDCRHLAPIHLSRLHHDRSNLQEELIRTFTLSSPKACKVGFAASSLVIG